MKLSIIMPVYNEASTIDEIVRRVRNVEVDCAKELIIVDDGSTDGTRGILQMIAHGSPDIKLVVHERNLGKGAAVRTALAHATGDVVLIQDADLEYDPRDYPRLLGPIREGYADVVFGNRFHGGPHRVLYFRHHLGNRILTTLTNVVTDLNLSDMEVGYKVFRADVLRQMELRSNRFGFEPEVAVKVAKRGCRIYEVAISYHGRTYEEGKKATWRDGLAAVYCLLRYSLFD